MLRRGCRCSRRSTARHRRRDRPSPGNRRRGRRRGPAGAPSAARPQGLRLRCRRCRWPVPEAGTATASATTARRMASRPRRRRAAWRAGRGDGAAGWRWSARSRVLLRSPVGPRADRRSFSGPSKTTVGRRPSRPGNSCVRVVLRPQGEARAVQASTAALTSTLRGWPACQDWRQQAAPGPRD